MLDCCPTLKRAIASDGLAVATTENCNGCFHETQYREGETR
jgi:hypothetical protein